MTVSRLYYYHTPVGHFYFLILGHYHFRGTVVKHVLTKKYLYGNIRLVLYKKMKGDAMKRAKRYITSDALATSTRCRRIGDIVFFPRTPPLNELMSAVGKLRKKGLLEKVFPKNTFFSLNIHPFEIAEKLKAKYENEKSWTSGNFQEPQWIEELPSAIKRYLRFHQALDSWDYQPLFIVFGLPYSGLNYLVAEDGLTQDAFRIFPKLYRLQDIKQLGLLQDPVVSEISRHAFTSDFSHRRLCHSLDVMALLTLVLENNNISPKDSFIPRFAGLTHDALTPAGGDTIKLIDPQAFDEDAHFAEFLDNTEWRKYSVQHGISSELIIQTVQGYGLWGSLLDICDKIAYVSRDVNAYLGIDHGSSLRHVYPQSYQTITDATTSSHHVTGIWDAVRIINGKMIIINAKRLYNFLKLRTLLFRELYYHPGSRFKEFMISHIIVKYFYDMGKITRGQLLSMTDIGLEKFIDRELKSQYILHTLDMSPDVRVEAFATIEKAQAREQELIKNGFPITLLENLRSKIKPETHYLVPAPDKTFKPFSETYPELHADILALGHIDHPIRLYYFANPAPPFNNEFIKAFMAYRKRELTKASLKK